eukprot:m51a1_g6117 putative isoform b (742) ;mRNA; r:124568-128342
MVHAALAVAALALGCALACDLDCQWAEYKRLYGKSYATQSEDQRHLAAFRLALADIAAQNAQGGATYALSEGGATYALSEHSDMPADEFRARFTGYVAAKRPPAGSAPPRIVRRGPLPANFRSPYATPSRNQQDCGGCWRTHGNNTQTKAPNVFAPEQLLDCDTWNKACSGGDYFMAADFLQRLSAAGGGAELEASMPYVNRDNSVDLGRRACTYDASKAVGKANFWYRFDMDESDDSPVMHMLYENGPLAMSINADPIQNYHGGVVSKSNCGSGTTTNHAVVLIGWGVADDGTKYWLVKNSWGPKWPLSNPLGDGTFKIVRGENACGVATTQVMGIVAPGDSFVFDNSEACGSRQCGVVDRYDLTKEPNFIVCGGCAAGYTCTAEGKCEQMWSEDTWLPTNGAAASDFEVSADASGILIDTADSPRADKYIRWRWSAQWAAPWTMLNATVTAKSAGSFGIGMTSRSGSSAGALFRLEVVASSGIAKVRACALRNGTRGCMDVGTAIVALNTPVQISALFVRSSSGVVGASLYVGGVAVLGSSRYVAFGSSGDFLSEVGDMIVSATGDMHVASPSQTSRTHFTAISSVFTLTADQWSSLPAITMFAPESSVGGATRESSSWPGYFEDAQYLYLQSPVTSQGTYVGAFGGGIVANHMASAAMLARFEELIGGDAVVHTGLYTQSIKLSFADRDPQLSGTPVAFAATETVEVDISPDEERPGAAPAAAHSLALALLCAAAAWL